MEDSSSSQKLHEPEVRDVRNVTRQEDDTFAVDAIWTVNGSVIHFGHTHYRQNRYHAVVSILRDEGAWKICRLDLIDEQRVL